MAEFYMEKRVVGDNPTGSSARAAVTIDPHQNMALMIATATASSKYTAGNVGDSGIVLTITGRTGGVTSTVRSDSFEARSSTVNYSAAAALTLVVQPSAVGQIFAEVEAIGTAGSLNHDTRVELHVVAIDI
jgi:hypothetical protein